MHKRDWPQILAGNILSDQRKFQQSLANGPSEQVSLPDTGFDTGYLSCHKAWNEALKIILNICINLFYSELLKITWFKIHLWHFTIFINGRDFISDFELIWCPLFLNSQWQKHTIKPVFLLKTLLLLHLWCTYMFRAWLHQNSLNLVFPKSIS